MRDGYKAKIACEKKLCNFALENVVEANTFLSTIGFESGGLGGAHAFQHAFDLLPGTGKYYHGEKVAFCTICQLTLENAPIEEIEKVIAFCYNVGLPITLEDIGVINPTSDDLMKVAKRAAMKDVSMVNMPFTVTPQDNLMAIQVADELGRKFKQKPLAFVNKNIESNT
jgi:glycerol dehydrogenase